MVISSVCALQICSDKASLQIPLISDLVGFCSKTSFLFFRYGPQAGVLAKECFEGVGNIVDAAVAVDNVIWKLQPEVFAISFTKKTMRHVVGSQLARIAAEEYQMFASGQMQLGST
jgi:hypothetical protein